MMLMLKETLFGREPQKSYAQRIYPFWIVELVSKCSETRLFHSANPLTATAVDLPCMRDMHKADPIFL